MANGGGNGSNGPKSGLRRAGTQKKGRQIKATKKGYYGSKTTREKRKKS